MKSLANNIIDSIHQINGKLGNSKAFVISLHPSLKETIQQEHVAEKCETAGFSVLFAYPENPLYIEQSKICVMPGTEAPTGFLVD